jgi:peptidoglycan DL-endopeptidase LytE
MEFVLVRFKLLTGLSATAVMGLSFSTAYAASTVQYTVHRGDSLWSISQRYGVSLSSLETWNHLSASSVIHVGQRIVIEKESSSTSTSTSSTKTTSPSSSSSTYIVKSGDTLWSISQRYGIPLSSLEAWNNLRASSVLHVGQKIIIKGGSFTLGSRRSSPVSGVVGFKGYEVAQYAEQFIGVPYVWGGTTPSGFDCSGLVQYVYAHFGTTLPRTSYEQFNIGTSVPTSDLMPGDIVFFDTFGSGASHDGIFIGNGQFISATSSKVEIDSLSNPYWSAHYLGARRP